jgi:hypothetical protein
MKIRSTKLEKLPLSMVVALSIAAMASACTQQAEAPTQAPEPVAPATAEVPAADAVPAPPEAVASQFGPALPADLQGVVTGGGECGIEATAEVAQGSEIPLSRSKAELIEGWMLDREDRTKPTSAYLKLESGGEASYFVPLTLGNRAGLGVRLGDESFDAAAFAVTAGLSEVPVGQYNVQVAQRIGEKILLCATGRTAKVTD